MESKEIKFAGKAPSHSYLKRKTAIESLMAIAVVHLRFFAFEARKQKGAKANLMGLGPGFSRERTQFQCMKDDYPHLKNIDPQSSSFVAAGQSDIRGGLIPVEADVFALANKPIDQLSNGDFRRVWGVLESHFGVNIAPGNTLPRVHFVRKQERINNNMLISLPGRAGGSSLPKNLLYKDSAHYPYTSSGEGVRNRDNPNLFDIAPPLDIYAIDKYGNIMVAPNEKRYGGGSHESEYRHSSLNAGNDVIGAGRIQILSGQVKYFDNWSGHYRPTVGALARAAVCVSEAHGLDLTMTKIVLFFVGPPQTKTLAQLAPLAGINFFQSF